MTKNMKALYSTNYKSSSDLIPKIQMEGKWLQKLGFSVGDIIAVDYENGSIRIRPLTEEERTAQEQKELAVEIKRHKARLKAMQQEHSNLCIVAEKGSSYCAKSDKHSRKSH